MREKDKREKKILYKNSGGRCYICRRKLDFDEMTTDHVIPKSLKKNVRNKSFIGSIKNKRCCCQRCNRDKGNMTLYEYCFYMKERKYTYMSQSKISKLLWISQTITNEAMRRKRDDKT